MPAPLAGYERGKVSFRDKRGYASTRRALSELFLLRLAHHQALDCVSLENRLQLIYHPVGQVLLEVFG